MSFSILVLLPSNLFFYAVISLSATFLLYMATILFYSTYSASVPRAAYWTLYYTPCCSSVSATFADDTALFSSHTVAANNLQHSLVSSVLGGQWKIRINVEKSANFTSALWPHSYMPVTINSTVIPYRSTIRYLGVYLDERLNYAPQVRIKR